MSSPPSSSEPSGELFVATLVSRRLGTELRRATGLTDVSWLELEEALAEEQTPDIVVVEMTSASDGQLRRVLADPQLLGAKVVLIGSTAPGTRQLVRSRPRVHHMDSEAKTAQIASLISGLEPTAELDPFGTPAPAVRSLESAASVAPSSRGSLAPTNLFPSTSNGGLPPSTHPSLQPPGWTIPPALLETGNDEISGTPPTLSREVEALLQAAEQRVSSELFPQVDSLFEGPERATPIHISSELHAALTDPIDPSEPGDELGGPGANTDARTTSEGRTLTHASKASELCLPPRGTPNPPAAATPITVRPLTRPQHPATPAPGPTSMRGGKTDAATLQPAHSVPRAPAIPEDVWNQINPASESSEVSPAESSKRPSDGPGSVLAGLTPSKSPSPEELQSSPTVPPLKAARGEIQIPNLFTDRARGQASEPTFMDAYSERPDRQTGQESKPPPSPREGYESSPLPPPESAVAAPPQKDVATSLEGELAIESLACAIHERRTGALTFESEQGVIRRVVLREGDLVTAASSASSESLVRVLMARGVVDASSVEHLAPRLPSFGRRAGAALIADGHLAQAQLWPVLRAHAEEIVGRILRLSAGKVIFEKTIPGRLGEEPSVFGGATGSEVFIELLKRVVPPALSIKRLGGLHGRLKRGARYFLLEECALEERERDFVETTETYQVEFGLRPPHQEEFAGTLYGLLKLGVLEQRLPSTPQPEVPTTSSDRLDEAAIRNMVRTRRALVDDGDYFSLLGLAPDATSYDVRRAYLELKRRLNPQELLTPQTLDLHDDLQLILEVATEAFEILRDGTKRERYKRALLAFPEL